MGRIDTLENAEAVRSKLEEVYRSLGPDNVRRDATAGLDACFQAMAPFSRYESMMNSGYNELKSRCTEMQRPMQQSLQERFMQAENQRTSTRAEADRAEKQQEADRVAAIVADLKSGKRQPINCAEYMVTKGNDPATLNAPVMHVAYQAAKGIGMFRGNVERIDGATIVLNDRIPDLMRLTLNPPDHMIAKTTKDTRVFAGERIRTDAMLEGFATQTGTQSVTMASGRAATIAVMNVVCMQPR